MPVVAGVDSSTQSTKVELRDADDGRMVGTGRAPHPATSPPLSEQDPSDWWQALIVAMGRALDEASAHGVRRGDIGAISVAGQQHGLVVLDAADEVIRPAKLWNDTESAPDAAWLVSRLDDGSAAGSGPDAWARACGSVPVAAFTITKLSWLHRSEPEAFGRIARVLLPHDWLTHRLTGGHTTDRGDASGTGYWSAAEDRYRLDLLSIVDADTDWAAALPRVLGPVEPAGELTPAAADALGLAAGITVGPGTGDNMAAALGTGLRPGELAVSIGTSGTVYAVSDHPTADPTGAVAGFADASGRHLPLVCTLNATLATDAVRRLLDVDHATFDELALGQAAGAGGLVFVPYLAGERTPNRPDATGTLAGIRPDVDRPQLARAAFEGVVCGLLEGVDALAAAGVDTIGARTPGATGRRLVLAGGGARSAAYRQVLADLSGRPVTVPHADELVAAGAAVQAAAVAGGHDPTALAATWHLTGGTVVEPDVRVDRDAVRAAYARVRA